MVTPPQRAQRDDVLPPYPMLVTVGQDDDGLRLVNLEHLGVVALTGDTERAEALARHIAAELALNPWSTLVEVNVIGLGEELARSTPSVCATTPMASRSSPRSCVT